MIKTYRNIKLIVLCIIFFCASLYAIEAYRDILVNNDYSRNLIAKSLKLQESKVYLFTATNIISNNKDTIVIPIENKSFPDSLCYLFYDNEWKLRLSNKLRNSDKETISNPLFPWCCTQQPHPTFFDKGSTVDEKFLTKDGIKFNYYSGNPVDRFALKLYKENGKSFLVGKLFFLENSYPINAKKDNLYELNFCNYTDTINDKYVFSFPFCGGGNKPERLLLNIQNDNVSYTNQLTNQITKINQPVFEINNIQF